MITFVDDLMILVGIIVVCATIVVLAGLVAGTLATHWETQKEPELIEERSIEIEFYPDTPVEEQLMFMRAMMQGIEAPQATWTPERRLLISDSHRHEM